MDVRKPGADPPVYMKGKGLGRTLGVWPSIDLARGRDGDFLLPALALELSRLAKVGSKRTPFSTLLGVESSTPSLIPNFRPDCPALDASPVAGV